MRFDKFIALAHRLITKNGMPVIWRTVRDGDPVDPLKPWLPSNSVTVDHVVDMCILPMNLAGEESTTYNIGTEVPRGSQLGYMGAVAFEPSIKDVVIINGKELRIVSLDNLAPNGQNILYTVEFEL